MRRHACTIATSCWRPPINPLRATQTQAKRPQERCSGLTASHTKRHDGLRWSHRAFRITRGCLALTRSTFCHYQSPVGDALAIANKLPDLKEGKFEHSYSDAPQRLTYKDLWSLCSRATCPLGRRATSSCCFNTEQLSSHCDIESPHPQIPRLASISTCGRTLSHPFMVRYHSRHDPFFQLRVLG